MEKTLIKSEVKWFNNRSGIGFAINPEDDKNDYFIHYSNIVNENAVYKTLKAGQTVTFEAGQTERGLIAYKIQIEE